MRILVWLIAVSALLLGARVEKLSWPKNRTFSEYLHHNKLDDLLRVIPAQDMEYVTEIQAGETYYELRDHGRLLQALIPLGEEMQIHLIYRPEQGYRFDIVPIAYRRIRDRVSFTVDDGYRRQIDRLTQHPRLASALSRLFKNDPLFRRLRPKDRFAFAYTQRARLGEPHGRPEISAALIQTHGKEHFVYVDPKGQVCPNGNKTVTYTRMEKHPYTYTTVRKVKSPRFRMPVDHPRITSRFSYRRWHPILHKYRPHFGVDFGARRGTPLRAVNDGRVVYAGWMRGYGKVVKIDHGAGLVSLYAHQSRILVHRGQKVKRGQTIGRVGSTGRSTGPHLHFGLYRHGKPVDPLRYLARKGTGKTKTIVEKHTVMKRYPVSRHKYVSVPGAQKAKKRLISLIKHPGEPPYRWYRSEKNMVHLNELIPQARENKEAHDG